MAGCDARTRRQRPARRAVSILTRRGGRVRRGRRLRDQRDVHVSILTRRGGRVRPGGASLPHFIHSLFQSSPGVVAGCDRGDVGGAVGADDVSILTRRGGRVRRARLSLDGQGRVAFQSSPGVVAGCDRCRGSGPPSWASFNPHPAWWPGATYRWIERQVAGELVFQSSPGVVAGCDNWYRSP